MNRDYSGKLKLGWALLALARNAIMTAFNKRPEKALSTHVNAPNRLDYLDGLRGWAALAVVGTDRRFLSSPG